MEQQKIQRINALSRLSRERALTEDELAEQAALRREYIDAMKSSLKAELDNTYLVDEQGNKRKLAQNEQNKKD